MKRAWVLMTAMPPTRGHERLVEFARSLDVDETVIVLNTQPDEPYVTQRVNALFDARNNRWGDTRIAWYNQPVQQVPNGEDDNDFWYFWRDLLEGEGLHPGDYIVASEEYGVQLAEVTHCRFMPYDIDREIYESRATWVREDPINNFDMILPEFQPHLRQRVTVFGAESTGKTTLSRALSSRLGGYWLPEWARPYLETVGDEITEQAMLEIWRGQSALQRSAAKMSVDHPFIVQDTDLYSTVGYWEGTDWGLGHVPSGLLSDAEAQQSHLYIVTTSNIPFEPDPLRYGGDHRELSDEFWIQLLEDAALTYVVLDSAELSRRVDEAVDVCLALFNERPLTYERVR